MAMFTASGAGSVHLTKLGFHLKLPEIWSKSPGGRAATQQYTFWDVWPHTRGHQTGSGGLNQLEVTGRKASSHSMYVEW